MSRPYMTAYWLVEFGEHRFIYKDPIKYTGPLVESALELSGQYAKRYIRWFRKEEPSARLAAVAVERNGFPRRRDCGLPPR